MTFFTKLLEFARRSDVIMYVLVAILTIVTTWFALDLFHLRWSVPMGYQGDAILISSHIKTDIETGWYESQSLLGAPFGQVYHDWKSADNLHHMIVSLTRGIVPDWGVAINLYFVLGFLFAGLTAAWFLRLVGVSRAITVPLAVLYAIAPYHFIRGEGHMWLSSYYPIPLALGIVYLIAVGRPVWGKHATRNGVFGWLTGPAALTVAALALVGTANSYYGFFTVLLIALVGLIRFIADRRWKPFFGAVVAGGFTAVVMLLNMLPDILYNRANGPNPIAVGRFPVEAELYSLKFMQLVLPMPDHRVSFLSSLRNFYDSAYPFTSESPALGIVAASGFVAAFVFILYLLIGRIRGWAFSPTRVTALGVLSGLVLFTFLLSTFGGLSSLISFFTSDLRGWNRMSILIAMLSLAMIGLLIDTAIDAFARRKGNVDRRRSVIAVIAAVLILVVGYADQVSPNKTPNHAAIQAEFDADEAMVSQIEELVPSGSMIMQLPFRQFPETPPINGVFDTDQLKPYLHSETLRWSGGGIKGRPASEWVGLASNLPVDGMVRSVSAAGFAGVLVDRRPYDDNGAKIVRQLKAVLGEEAFTAQDGRYVFFLLPADELAAGISDTDLADMASWVINPVYPRFTPDYSRGYTLAEGFGAYEPQIELDNPRTEPVSLRLNFSAAYLQGDATFRFTSPDGSFTDVPVTGTPDEVEIDVIAPPGRTVVSVSVVEGPEPIKSRTNSGPIVVTDIVAHDTAFERLLESLETADAN